MHTIIHLYRYPYIRKYTHKHTPVHTTIHIYTTMHTEHTCTQMYSTHTQYTRMHEHASHRSASDFDPWRRALQGRRASGKGAWHSKHGGGGGVTWAGGAASPAEGGVAGSAIREWLLRVWACFQLIIFLFLSISLTSIFLVSFQSRFSLFFSLWIWSFFQFCLRVFLALRSIWRFTCTHFLSS